MKQVKPFIKVIPFLMLGICFIAALLVHNKYYPVVYGYLSNTIGFSLITNVYFLYFIIRHRMCTYALVATIGLVILNLSDISKLFLNFDDSFYEMYIVVISGISLLITTAFFIKHL